MARTREEDIIDIIMNQEASFILGQGAGIQAHQTIRELLKVALLDEKVFKETWKKFFRGEK